VTATEILRLIWTIGTGLGTLVMLVLLREVRQDAWAMAQVRPPGLDVLRMFTLGEVMDQSIRLSSIVLLFLAGVLSYLGPYFTPVVIGLLCLSAAAQVWLGVVKLNRRRRIFHALILQRKKASP
jgi:hypothetical protein